MRRRWWMIVLVLVVPLVARPSRATVLVPMSDEDLVGSSELIAVGTVGGIETVLLGAARIVTRITLAVERTLKGAAPAGTIVITEPGGRIGARAVVIFGAPEYTTGERVLVFLRVRRDGSLSTNALALGKYGIAPDARGRTVARRAVPRTDERPLGWFVARIEGLASGRRGAATDGRSGAAVAQATSRIESDAFTFQGTPPSRWFEGDCGRPITLSLGNTDLILGEEASRVAVSEATAAWTVVDGASLTLTIGADTTPAPSVIGGTIDDRNTVQFNDPFGEVEDVVACTGVLARGGFNASFDEELQGLSKTVGGTTFARIFEGDVTMNQGIGDCIGATTFAEVLAHEIGHAIGFGHSSNNPLESDPILADALMFFQSHDDGRGASVRADDIAAMVAAYPSTLAATTPLANLACEIDMGLLGFGCFDQHLAGAPFARFQKARGVAVRALAAPAGKKQRKVVKKVLRLLVKTDKAITRTITGACGTHMHGIVARLQAQATALLGIL